MCTICALTIEFAVEHPMALSVAAATRRAIDGGLLSHPPEREQDMVQSRHQAVMLLTTMQRRIEQVLSRSKLLAMPNFFILMVESRTWGYFHPTLDGFDVRANPSSPRIEPDANGQRDAIVVMSQAAADELVAGRLPFSQAMDAGVTIVDAPMSTGAPILSALTKAYPVGEFSDFVCTEVA